MSQEPETQKDPGSQDSIPKEKLDLETFKDLSNKEQVNALFRNQVRVERKVDKLLNQLEEKEVVDKGHEQNPLDRFEDNRVDEFRRRLKEAGNGGLTYTDLKNIFNRSKSVAYELMDDLPEHNSYIKKVNRGPNQKNILVHEKKYLTDEILDIAGSDIDQILKAFIEDYNQIDKDNQEILDDLFLEKVKELYHIVLKQETSDEDERRSRAPAWI